MGVIPSNPTLIPVPFAANGQKNAIPQNAAAVGAANASWDQGFPGVTMIAKQAGGKPPLGKDFNGVLNQLSNNAYFAQSGCVYAWNNTLNYLAGSHAQATDGHEYVALQPSGPDIPAAGGGYVGAQNPISAPSFWIDLTNAITSASGGGAGYEICTVVYNNFIGPSGVAGMVPVTGTLVANAATNYPDAWAYLQTSDGQTMCCTEAEWQAASTAVYYTGSDGTQYSWNGVGGVCKYVIDTNAGTIRVPDLRGMYPAITPFDSLNVGGVQPEGAPEIVGQMKNLLAVANATGASGAFSRGSATLAYSDGVQVNISQQNFNFSAKKYNPVYGGSNYIRPRSYGVNGYVYLGTPAA